MVLPLRTLRTEGAMLSFALAALLCALPACNNKDKPA